MKTVAAVAFGLAFCLTTLTPAFGHGSHHHGCRGHDCRDCGDSSASGRQQLRSAPASWQILEKIEGEVAEVIYLPGTSPSAAGVELRLQAGKESTLLRLAPTGCLKKSGFALKEGDPISVKGFRVDTEEGEFVVATEVEKDGNTLRLRDTRGRPLW